MYWAEFLKLEHAKPIAYYDHPFFGRWPAITQNQFGKGTLTYEGTFLSDALQHKMVTDVLNDAHLLDTNRQLPDKVREKSGVNGEGKTIHYFLNYSSDPQTFTYSQRPGVDLLTGKKISSSQSINLAPWDLIIAEEN